MRETTTAPAPPGVKLKWLNPWCRDGVTDEPRLTPAFLARTAIYVWGIWLIAMYIRPPTDDDTVRNRILYCSFYAILTPPLLLAIIDIEFWARRRPIDPEWVRYGSAIINLFLIHWGADKIRRYNNNKEGVFGPRDRQFDDDYWSWVAAGTFISLQISRAKAQREAKYQELLDKAMGPAELALMKRMAELQLQQRQANASNASYRYPQQFGQNNVHTARYFR